MKTTKFRAWQTFDKRFIENPCLTFLEGEAGVSTFSRMHSYGQGTTSKTTSHENCVIQQFTGIKDKNGKEIYEGDTIFADETIFEVVFEYGCFMVRNIDLGVETDEASQQYFTPLYEYPDCEVIGNIFKEVKI